MRESIRAWALGVFERKIVEMTTSLTRIARIFDECRSALDCSKMFMATLCGVIFLSLVFGSGSAWAGTVYTEIINDTETNSVTPNGGPASGPFANLTQIYLGAPLGVQSWAYNFRELGTQTPETNQVEYIRNCNIFGCTTQEITYPVSGVHQVLGAGIEIRQQGDFLGELTDVPGLPTATEMFSGTGYLSACVVNPEYCTGTGECFFNGCNELLDTGTKFDFPEFSGTKYLHLKFLVGADYYLGTATLLGTGSSLTLSEIQYTAEASDMAGSAAPEPGTWALAIMGFGLAGAALRRRRDRALS